MNDAQVIWYESADAGAPVLSGTAGALIDLLDATLVNGWGLQAATSLAVASGIATLSTGSAHNAKDHGVVEVSGAVPADLNGRHRVISRTSNTLTFAATGVADQAASGAITVNLAPAGWAKVFSGANVAVYRSPNPGSTRQFLRVDDTTTTHASIWCCEDMTDANTFAGRWLQAYWFKSSTANTIAQDWEIFADDRTFYLQIKAGNQEAMYPFGDFAPNKQNDPYACASMGYDVDTLNSISNLVERSAQGYLMAGTGGTPKHLTLARAGNYLAGGVGAYRRAEFGGLSTNTGTSSNTIVALRSGVSGSNTDVAYGPAYPNISDNALVFGRFFVMEGASHNWRGSARGIYCSPQALTDHFPYAAVSTLDAQGLLAGRKIAVVGCRSIGSSNAAFSASRLAAGRVVFDITGPWG